MFLRSTFLTLFILPAAIARGGVATRRPSAHFGRSVIGLGGFVCMLYAIADAPLADVTALTFTKQLFMVPLAILLLGEAVGWRRWGAVIVGFLGVLIMVRPGGGTFDLALAAALGNGLLTAYVAIVLKLLARTERPETMVFYFGFFSALLDGRSATLGGRVTATFAGTNSCLRLLAGAVGQQPRRGMDAARRAPATCGRVAMTRAWTEGRPA